MILNILNFIKILLITIYYYLLPFIQIKMSSSQLNRDIRAYIDEQFSKMRKDFASDLNSLRAELKDIKSEIRKNPSEKSQDFFSSTALTLIEKKNHSLEKQFEQFKDNVADAIIEVQSQISKEITNSISNNIVAVVEKRMQTQMFNMVKKEIQPLVKQVEYLQISNISGEEYIGEFHRRVAISAGMVDPNQKMIEGAKSSTRSRVDFGKSQFMFDEEGEQ